MANLVFDDKTVLDVLKHEHPQFYTLQMVEGPDVMVSIDKMMDALFDGEQMSVDTKTGDVRYNNETFDSEREMRTQITNDHVFRMLNSGLVGYTEIEPLNETV